MTTQTTKTEDVGTLIARLREATESSRALDAAIAVALGAEARIVGKLGWRMRFCPWQGHPDHRWQCLTRWTDSVDAALTLVPDNVWLEIKTAGVTPGPNERLYPVVEYGANDADHTVQARTIPLALCIAALLARRAP